MIELTRRLFNQINMKQWLPIETPQEHTEASERFEKIYDVKKGSPDYKEMLLLSILISEYEKRHFSLPSVDPIEMIKSRMEDFGYKPADLAREYGDQGTISKVLNYKQPLSLTMIRVFSKLLRIPADLLTKEYSLENGSLSASQESNVRKAGKQRQRTPKRRSTSTAK